MVGKEQKLYPVVQRWMKCFLCLKTDMFICAHTRGAHFRDQVDRKLAADTSRMKGRFPAEIVCPSLLYM